MADPLIALVPQEVGDVAQVTITPSVLATLTDAYADKSGVPRLQYLYVKRHALALILGPEWQNVSFNEQLVLQESLSDRLKGLLAMRAAVQGEIEATETQAGASRPPALTPMTRTAPITQADGQALGTAAPQSPYDANNPALTGSPYTPPSLPIR